MATGKKRTLGAERHPGPGETVGERVRDAGARPGERVRRPGQRHKEHGSNTAQGERRQYERERAREQRQTRRDAAGSDGDPIARLKLRTQLAQDQFTHHLRTSGITSPGGSKPAQRKKLSDLHQAYVSMMVLQCLDPLQRGLSAENVLRTVGMGTAMWLLSPNFRSQVGDHAGQMVTAIGNRLDMRARREAKIVAEGERSREKEAQHFDRTGRGREGMRGLSGRRHRRRLERIERMERGGRDLFTEHSAALTHVGIAQNAYDEMRRPGADRERVRQNYESALSALYGYVDADGLDRKAVARNMRIVVGQLIERDPEQAAVFSELGHGRFVKTGPRTVVLSGTTQSVTAWTGDYVDSCNGDVITGGTFALREPMGVDEHRAAVARTVYGELTGANSPAEFSEVLEQYVIGSATREYPEAVELTEDATARARLGRSRVMFASMRGDGLSDKDQKLVYISGFVESLQALDHTHPQLVAQWRRSLEPEWEQRMRDLIAEYDDFGQQAARDREQQGARVWAEPERASPAEAEEADIVDADIVDDEPGDGRRSSSPGSRERGATTRSSASAPVTAPGGVVVRERGEACRRAGLVDEHGDVDEKRLTEMEAKGVPLGRAARAEGAWFMNEAALAVAKDDRAKRVVLIEAMSDHMANDVLGTVRTNGGKNPVLNMWPVVRVWRNRATALGPLDPADPETLRRPWGQDEASNTRAREMGGMSTSMSFLNLEEQDRLHSLAYVRALEKVVSAEPSCEKFVHDLTAHGGGDPRDWRQHEYEAALERGYSGQRQSTYQQECERCELDPVTEHRGRGPDAESRRETAVTPVADSTGVSSVTPGVLVRNEKNVRQNQAANGVRTGRPIPASGIPSLAAPERDNEPEIGG